MNIAIVLLAALALALPAGAQVRRDPFARPAAAVSVPAAADSEAAANVLPPAPPRVRAILYEPGKSLVNINGHILAVGDRFDDYQVTAIGARSATLTRRGVRSVVVLDEESSK